MNTSNIQLVDSVIESLRVTFGDIMGYDHNNWYWSDYSLELALLQTIPHNLYDHIQERINKFTYKQDGGKDACIDFASTLNELGTERTGLKLFVFK